MKYMVFTTAVAIISFIIVFGLIGYSAYYDAKNRPFRDCLTYEAAQKTEYCKQLLQKKAQQ